MQTRRWPRHERQAKDVMPMRLDHDRQGVAAAVIALIAIVVLVAGVGLYYVATTVVTPSRTLTTSSTNSPASTTETASASSMTKTSSTATLPLASPELIISLPSPNIIVGDSIYANATLSGATSNATGAVTFYLYNDSSCSSGQEWVSEPWVSGNGNYTSDERQFYTTGAYSWNAVYSGDSSNSGTTSTCVPLAVSPLPKPKISIVVNQTIIDDPQNLLILNLTASNTGSQAYSFNGDLQLQTNSGKLYGTFPASVTYAISWPASGHPHPFPGGSIPAGGKMAGEVAFRIPSNETASMLVYRDTYSNVNATASIPPASSWVSEVQGTGAVTITPSDLECGFGGGGACFVGQYEILNDSLLGSADFFTGQVIGVQVTIFLGAGQGTLLGFTATSGVSAFQVVSWTQFDCTGGNPTCSQWTFDVYLTTTPGASYSGGPDIVISLQQG